MYICNECGAVFEELATLEEHHPYGMTYATECWSVCPICKETDYEDAERCEVCDEWFVEKDLIDGMCEECYEKMEEEEE